MIVRRAILMATLALGLAAATVSPLAAQLQRDWMLIKYTNTGGDWISIHVTGHATGTGPVILGYGLAQPEKGFAWVLPFRIGWGPTTVSLSANGTRRTVQILAAPSGAFDSSIAIAPYDGPTAVLVFVANGIIDTISDDAPPGAVRLQGTGSRALEVGAVTSGAGVTAGAAAVAVGTATAHSVAGVVGGIEPVSCAACVGSWRSPSGLTRTWAQAHTYLGVLFLSDVAGIGPFTFAGPAGTWTWRWVGLGLIHARYGAFQTLEEGGPEVVRGGPVVAAWAPVGQDWKLWEVANHEPIVPL
jgi:hypothetical protein